MDKNNQEIMAEEARKIFKADLQQFGNKYGLTRIKIESLSFNHDYKRQTDGSFVLVNLKAVIRVMGKVTKVSIGEDEKYKTFEEAYEAIRQHWSDYYKTVRSNRTPKMVAAEYKRQKRYRQRLRAKKQELRERQ